jgi:hypothetical protein
MSFSSEETKAFVEWALGEGCTRVKVGGVEVERPYMPRFDLPVVDPKLTDDEMKRQHEELLYGSSE